MIIRENSSDDIKNKRSGFVKDFEEIIIGALSALKSDPQWADNADYYLALRYLCGMINNDLSIESNRDIGTEMMISFMLMDNELAIRFAAKYLL